MEKISVTLDLTKLDKSRIQEREYTNREGVVVKVKEYKIDVVELKQENKKSVFKGDGFEIVKTHFVTNTATKEERAAKTKTGFIGEGVTFKDTKQVNDIEYPSDADDINPDDIPFN